MPARRLLQVREFRGSSVLFEAGATGGTFVGVLFDDDQGDAEVRKEDEFKIRTGSRGSG